MLAGCVRTTRTGLQVRESLSLSSWKKLGAHLCVLEKGSPWWVGDWLVYGEQHFGNRYKEAGELTGLDYQTLRNYAWVASRFPMSRRRDRLSFQHHAEVASLDPDEQERWLSLAVGGNWSRNELRRQMRRSRSQLASLDATGASDALVTITLEIAKERYAHWSSAAAASGETLCDWMSRLLDAAASTEPPATTDDEPLPVAVLRLRAAEHAGAAVGA